MAPIKPVVAFTITSLATVFVCALGWRFVFSSNEYAPSDQVAEEIARGIQANMASIAALHSELSEVKAQLLRVKRSSKDMASSGADADSNDILGRLESIENVLDELNFHSLPPDKGGNAYALEQLVSGSLQESGDSESHTQYAKAETEFESNSGKPLGDFTATISDTLHSVDGLAVSGVDCRDTVCKVTYAKPESLNSLEGLEGRSELVDKLAQSAGERGVDIRFADDPSGNAVMYIQLQ